MCSSWLDPGSGGTVLCRRPPVICCYEMVLLEIERRKRLVSIDESVYRYHNRRRRNLSQHSVDPHIESPS